MKKPVIKLHKADNRPNAYGGTNYRTLCGRTNRLCDDGMNVAETDADVTCRFCRGLMARTALETPQPAPSAREYCTCNSKTNPCIVCGKPKFIDPEWLKRKLETDPDEGEIGAGFELFASPPHGAVEALRKHTLYRCDSCPEEFNCHPADETWLCGDVVYCDECRSAGGLIEGVRVSALAQPAAQEGWRSMESAPKDGTRILIKFVHTNAKYSEDPVGEGWIAVHEAYWIDHNGGGWTWHGLCGVAEKWMPLPLPAAPSQGSRS